MEYRLSTIARHKIYQEAVRTEHGSENLRMLVAHLNLLDNLEAHHAFQRSKHTECMPIRDRPRGFMEETVAGDVSSVDHPNDKHLANSPVPSFGGELKKGNAPEVRTHSVVEWEEDVSAAAFARDLTEFPTKNEIVERSALLVEKHQKLRSNVSGKAPKGCQIVVVELEIDEGETRDETFQNSENNQ